MDCETGTGTLDNMKICTLELYKLWGDGMVFDYGSVDVVLVTCLVAFPSSTCLAFSPNSKVLMVSAMFCPSGLMFTNIQAYRPQGHDRLP